MRAVATQDHIADSNRVASFQESDDSALTIVYRVTIRVIDRRYRVMIRVTAAIYRVTPSLNRVIYRVISVIIRVIWLRYWGTVCVYRATIRVIAGVYRVTPCRDHGEP